MLEVYRDGSHLVVRGDPDTDYKNVDIETDPQGIFAQCGPSEWRGETTANSGEFFATICEGEACILVEESFQIEANNSFMIGLVPIVLFLVYLLSLKSKSQGV